MEPCRTLTAWREGEDLTQEELANKLGLRSKSYISRLETGVGPPASPLVALRIQSLSGGQVKAESLCPSLALLPAPLARTGT